MPPKTRQSFNVNCQMIGDFGYLRQVLDSWQPSGILCMNSLNGSDPNNVVMQIHKQLKQWGGVTIYRPYEDGEPQLWRKRSVDAHLDMLARFNAPEIWYNVGNEPVEKNTDEVKRGAHWYAEMAFKAPRRGIRVVLPGGFATGTYGGAEILWWDEMFHAIGLERGRREGGYNVVSLGMHEYGHADPRLHVDGADVRLLTKKESERPPYKTKLDFRDDTPDDNYLVGRTETYLVRMAQLLGISRDQLNVDVHLTEKDLDRLPNIETQFRDVTDFIDSHGGKTYGYPTLHAYWRWMNGKEPHETMCDIWEWEEKTYPDYYRTMCNFSWTEHNDHPHFWRDRYGLHRDRNLHTAWARRIPITGAPGPVVVTPLEPVGKPTSPGNPESVQITASYKVRNGPGVNYAHVTTVQANDILVRYPATRRVGGNYYWIWVETAGSKDGWMADEGQFQPALPGWWTDAVKEPVLCTTPFVSQIVNAPTPARYNNCGEAALTMALKTHNKPYTLVEVMEKTNNNGQYLSLAQMLQAAQFFANDLNPRVVANMAMSALVDNILARKPVICLVQRGKLLPTFNTDFLGAHFVIAYGVTPDAIVIHDPYDVPEGKGQAWHVPPMRFKSAWESTPGNSGLYQALLLDRPIVTPPPPEPDDEETQPIEPVEVDFGSVDNKELMGRLLEQVGERIQQAPGSRIKLSIEADNE